jgi:hypothetical protein
MKLKRNRIQILIIMIFSAIGPLSGQSVYDLNFQGILADINGNPIINESFDLKVELKHLNGTETLYSFTETTGADEKGWFGFNIDEVSRFLEISKSKQSQVVIRIDIMPNSQTRWIGKGDEFMVTYTLTALQEGSAVKMTMKRMEGSELILHSEDHLFAFKDQYPFAYLAGGFLLTNQQPFNNQSLDDLKQWLAPSESEASESSSRGVKGGFPTGGYHRKK